MKAAAGSTLIELMTALMVVAIIGTACAALVRSHSLLVKNTSEGAAGAETLRTARMILRAELQDATTDDLRALASDSIGLRVFRGIGIVCALNTPRVTLRYRGLRLPDPNKDSLLTTFPLQTGTIVQMSSRSAPCTPRGNEQLVALEPDFPIAVGAIILFFESGSYHFAANALRYRRGATSLQPITDDLLDHMRSRLDLAASGRAMLLTLTTSQTNAPALQTVERVGFRNQ